jgi:ribosomal protein S14
MPGDRTSGRTRGVTRACHNETYHPQRTVFRGSCARTGRAVPASKRWSTFQLSRLDLRYFAPDHVRSRHRTEAGQPCRYVYQSRSGTRISGTAQRFISRRAAGAGVGAAFGRGSANDTTPHFLD